MGQRGKRVDVETQADIVKLYIKQDLTTQEIADTLGISVATVLKVLKRLEVPRRSLKQWAEVRMDQETKAVKRLLR